MCFSSTTTLTTHSDNDTTTGIFYSYLWRRHSDLVFNQSVSELMPMGDKLKDDRLPNVCWQKTPIQSSPLHSAVHSGN